MKRGLSLNFFALLIVAVFLVSAISELRQAGHETEIMIDECVEAYEYIHLFGGLIPVGTEHFYFACDNEKGEACIIKATPKWYTDNFTENGYPLYSNRISLSSINKSTPFELSRKLDEIDDGVVYTIPPTQCLLANYKTTSYAKLILGILGFIGVILQVIYERNPEKFNDTHIIPSIGSFIIFVAVSCYILAVAL
ncbi:MAG: hypothetical protein E7254_12835 [Lachnospiraceae bacterium]|nr:hypothetical protein [Lachnospiraceae bacterium]